MRARIVRARGRGRKGIVEFAIPFLDYRSVAFVYVSEDVKTGANRRNPCSEILASDRLSIFDLIECASWGTMCQTTRNEIKGLV